VKLSISAYSVVFRSLLFAWLLCGAMPAPAIASERADPAGKKEFIAIIPHDFAPTAFWDRDNNAASGFAVDVLNAVGARMDVKFTYVAGHHWKEILEAVESGRADVVPGIGVSKEREQDLLFTGEIYSFPISLFTLQENRSITGPENGITIGVVNKSVAYQLLKKNQAITLVQLDGYEDGLMSLLAGRIDAFCGPETNVTMLADEAGLGDRIRTTGRHIGEVHLAIGVKKSNHELFELIEKGMSGFVGSAEYKNIYTKWYGKKKSYWTGQRIAIALALATLLLAGMAALSRYLSIRQVNGKLRDTNKKLEHSEKQFRALAESVHAISWEYDIPADQWTYVAPQAERILGYGPIEWKNLAWWVERLHEDDRRWAPDYCAQATMRGENHEFEYRFLARDGREVWLYDLVNVEMADGRPMMMRGIMVDITARKGTERALLEATQRLDLATASAKLGVWDWNIRDNTMVWNDRMFELYGITRDAFPNSVKAWENGLHPDDRAGAIAHCEAALRNERVFDAVFRVQRPDGFVATLKADALVIRDAGGKALRMIGLNHDITEQVSLEEQLRQSQKQEAIGTLAGGIAHDFNNILMVVIGRAHLMKVQLPADGAAQETAEEIIRAAERAAHLTAGLLTYSRKQFMQLEQLDLNSLVRDSRPMIGRMTGAGIDVRVQTSERPLLIHADKGQMETVLTNLITNAREAMPRGGTLDITTSAVVSEGKFGSAESGRYALLTVADTGQGMTKSVLEHVFEPFFTTKGIGKGPGLGLSMVYGITRQHSGHVMIDSEPEKGTKVTIYLPLAQSTSPVYNES